MDHVWMVVTDGTCHGEYENAAGALLFGTEEEAVSFVNGCMDEELQIASHRGGASEWEGGGGKMKTWYGSKEAQFRNGDVVSDYRIEKVPVPKAKKDTSGKIWCLKVSYHYGDESYKNELDTYVRLFRTKDDAVKGLERVIRDDWTAEIDDGEGGAVSLADLRGKSEFDDVKHSSWYYSEDGTLAWSFYTDCHGYRGEVTEIELP